MSESTSKDGPVVDAIDMRVALRLAMAMFVLVVDTSLMNVSISAVVRDLGTTVSGVQSSIALEALVSAAFILIGSKVGDLIGRKRAFVIGLLGYAIGATSMTLAQSLLPVIIFWAIIGGIGASLLLPSMQSLIHGNFSGAAQKKVYALVGASAAIAAAVGPLLGGFITTYLSWRVGFALEVVVIAVVLSGMRRSRTCRTPALAPSTGSARRSRSRGWAGSSSASSSGRRAASPSARCSSSARSDCWADPVAAPPAACRQGRAPRPGPVHLEAVPVRRQRSAPPADRPRRDHDRPSDLPADGARVQRDGGRPVARPAVAEHVRDRPGRGGRGAPARPSSIIRAGFAIYTLGILLLLPIVPRATSGWYLVVPLIITGVGLGLLVSQLNNYTLAPISQERVSEAAGVNSAAGSFGLSVGLAFAGAIMLAALSFAFTHLAGQQRALAAASSSRSRRPWRTTPSC